MLKRADEKELVVGAVGIVAVVAAVVAAAVFDAVKLVVSYKELIGRQHLAEITAAAIGVAERIAAAETTD